MSSSALFQTKLVSIMEILVNSAVADICRLVDDGSAVLHFEISRSKSENEDLRLKLQLLERELQTVRRGRERSLNSVGIQVRVNSFFFASYLERTQLVCKLLWQTTKPGLWSV